MTTPQEREAWTAGPWSHSTSPVERDPRVWVYAPNGPNMTTVATVEAVMRDGDLCSLNLANAKLTAAAPTMAEALERLSVYFCEEDDDTLLRNRGALREIITEALRLAREGR